MKQKEKTKAAALMPTTKKIQAFFGRGRGRLKTPDDRQKVLQVFDMGFDDGAHVVEQAKLLGAGLAAL